MYVSPNFPTKKALREALAEGKEVTIWQPNQMFNSGPIKDGVHSIEGPHYPKPHSWYARVEVVGEIVKKVIS